MLGFLQANGSLIFFGLALLFMVFMHSGRGHQHGMGGGSGMGHQQGGAHEHDTAHEHGPDPLQRPLEKPGLAEKESATAVAAGARQNGHSSGCH